MHSICMNDMQFLPKFKAMQAAVPELVPTTAVGDQGLTARNNLGHHFRLQFAHNGVLLVKHLHMHNTHSKRQKVLRQTVQYRPCNRAGLTQARHCVFDSMVRSRSGVLARVVIDLLTSAATSPHTVAESHPMLYPRAGVPLPHTPWATRPAPHLAMLLPIRPLVKHLACRQQQAAGAADEGTPPGVNVRQLGWLQTHWHTLLLAHLRAAGQHQEYRQEWGGEGKTRKTCRMGV